MDGRTVVAISFAALFTPIIVPPTNAQPTRCGAAKLKATARNAICRLTLEAREASGESIRPTRAQRCDARLQQAFAQIEATRGDCRAEGEALIVEHYVDLFIDAVDTALFSATPNDCQAAKLKAAGKKVKCVLGAHARSAGTERPVAASTLQRCHDKLTARFADAEAKQSCATNGDADAIENHVAYFAGDAWYAIMAGGPPLPTTTTTSIPGNLTGSYLFSGAQVGSGCPFAPMFLSYIRLTQSGDTLTVDYSSPSCAFGAYAQLVPGGFRVSCSFQGGTTCAGGFGDPIVFVQGLLPEPDGTIQVSQRFFLAPVVPGPCDGCAVDWTGTMTPYP